MKSAMKFIAAALLVCVANPAYAIIQTTVSVEDERVMNASFYAFDVYLESSGNDVLMDGNPETSARLDTLQLLFNFSSATALTVTGARVTSYFDWSAYGNASGTETGVQYTLRGHQPATADSPELSPRVAIDAWELATASAAGLFEITHGAAGKTRLFTVSLPINDDGGRPRMEIDARTSFVRSSQSAIGVQAMSVVSDGAGGYRAGSLTRRADPIESLRPVATITARAAASAESVGAVFDVEVPHADTETTVAWRLSVADGSTATAADFSAFSTLPGSGSLTLPMGTSRGVINVSFTDDTLSEPEDGFVLTLLSLRASASGGAAVPLAVQSSASSAIAASDPVLNTSLPATTTRGQPVALTVSLSRPSDGEVGFTWEFIDDGVCTAGPQMIAADYDFDGDLMPDANFPEGTTTVPFGQSSITINVGTYDDPGDIEDVECSYVDVYSVMAATIIIDNAEGEVHDYSIPTATVVSVAVEPESRNADMVLRLFPQPARNIPIYYRAVAVSGTNSIDNDDLRPGSQGGRDCLGATARCRIDTRGGPIGILFPLDDDVVEPQESFRIVLLPDDGYALGAASSGVGGILASDRQLEIAASRPSAGEGDTLDFIVSLTAQSVSLTEPMQLTYRITGTDAITAGDFADGLEGTFTMGPNERSTTLPLVLRDDGVFGELAEDFTVALVNATGGGLGHTNNLPTTPAAATITRSLEAQFAADPVRVSEGGKARIVVSLSRPDATADTEIEFDLVGVAGGYDDDDVDFDTRNFARQTVGDTTTNTAVITRGEVTTTIEIQIQDDMLNEGAESFYVQFDPVVSIAAIPTRTLVTIAASDPITASVARKEGDTGGEEDDPNSPAKGDNPTGPTTATFVVTLSGGEATSETRVGWSIVFGEGAGQASADDISENSRMGEVRIAVTTMTAEIKVGIAADTTPEIAESYTVRLNSVTGGGTGQVSLGAVSSVTAQIPANDAQTLTVAARPQASVSEDVGTASFRVAYGDGSVMPPQAVLVRYRLSGTATGGGDYEYPAGYGTTSGTATIGTGASSVDVSVSITNDMRDEDDETIVLELFEIVSGVAVTVLPANTSATLTIEDDDKLSLSVAASATLLEEAAEPSVTFTVSLLDDGMTPTRSRTSEVRVSYVLLGDATGGGVDYTDPSGYDAGASSGVIVLAVGANSADVSITVVNDELSEGDETITFALTEVTEGGELAELRGADTTRASVTIIDDDVARRFYIVAAADPATVAEGAEITYRVGYDGTVVGATPVTVSWTVAGTEERGADVAADLGEATGELVFGSGEADDKSVVLRALADTLNEGDERFTISISDNDARSGVYSTASVLTTISDDPDDTLQISIARSDDGPVDLMEGATATFVVSVGNATATAALAIPYAVSGAGVGAGDYTLMPTTMVTIAQGVTMATVTLEVVDDNTNEGAETLNVELGTVAGALGEVTLSMPSASAVITTNDAITVSVARLAGDTGGAEGTSAAFVVTLSGGQATSETMVGWSISVSMEAGEASTADFAAIMGELRVPAGETTGRIEVGITDDDDVEADETYTLTLGDPTGGGTGEVALDVASATARIPANDALPALSVAVLPEATVVEGAEAPVLFRVRYGDGGAMPSEVVSVRYRLSGSATGAADGSGDYEYPAGYDAGTSSGTVVIGTGASFVDVSVSITDDMRDEEDESIVFELFEIVSGGAVAVLPANTSASVTIEDDDKLSLSVAASAASLEEAAEPSVTFTVSLLDDGMTPVRTRTTEVRVAYTLGGTAAGAGTDYTDPSGYDAGVGSGVVVLAAGANSTGVSITVVNDDDSEGDETITFALTEVTAGGELAELRDADTTRASVTIIDDDVARWFYITSTVASVAEGEAATYTVGYAGMDVGATPVTVSWTVAGAQVRGADVAADLGAGTGELVFVTGGAREQTIALRTLADTLNEGDERFTIAISEDDALSDVYSTAASVVTTISDDPADELRISIVRGDSGDLMEGAAALADRSAEFVISVGNATATAALTVSYAVSGAGVSTGDYTLMPTTMVTIAQGVTMATVTLEAVDDDYNEGAETLNVELGAVAGALGAAAISASASSASATIAENDAITVSVARKEGDTGGVEYDSGDNVPAEASTTATFVVTLAGGRATTDTVIDWEVVFGEGVGQASRNDITPDTRSGDLRIPAGRATSEIRVEVAPDTRPEIAESYTVRLSSVAGGGTGQVSLGAVSSATAQIPANDARGLSAYRRHGSAESVPEADGQEVAFTLQWGNGGTDGEPPTTLTVSYRLSGSAEGGADYRYPAGYDGDSDSGRLMIAISTYTGTVTMAVVGDALDEDDETITFEVLEVVSGTGVATVPANTSATVTIMDDDKSSLEVSASARSVDEEGGAVTFTVSLLNDGAPTTRTLARDVRVSYVLSGSATGGGVDYRDPVGYGATSGVMVLRAGAVSTDILITVVNDDDLEGDETITIALTGITEGGELAELRVADTTRASVAIIDDDVARWFYVTSTVVSVAEGEATTYTVGYDGTLVGATPVTVSWTVAGTGARGAVAEDLEGLAGLAGEVVFVSGGAREQTIALRTAADTLNEGDEQFTIAISEDDVDSGVYSTGASVVTTISDDPADALEISIVRSDSGDLMEGAALMADSRAEFVISVGNATATAALTIPYAVSGAGVSADDYTLMPTTMVTIAQGVTMAMVTLEVVDDNYNEGAETLNVELGTVEGALGEVTLSMPSASAVITTNDAITVSVARKQGDTGGEEDDPESLAKGNNPTGPTTATFVVTLSGGEATSETRVGWSIVFGEGAGQASADDISETSRMGEVRIAVTTMTAEIKVGIAADTTPEIAESYTVRLDGVTGGGTGQVSLGVSSSATAQIPANDAQTLSVAARPSASVSEDAGTASFRIAYGDGSVMPPQAVSVRYRLSGTATGGGDYEYPAGYDAGTTSGTATIGTGASFADVSVSITNDMRDEDDETVVLELFGIVSGGDVAVLPANTSASVTIEDDDKLSLSVAASAASVEEAAESSVTFTVSLLDDGAEPTRTRTSEVRVSYVFLGSATGGGVDYSDPSGYDAGSGVIVLAAGANSTDVTITVVNDNLGEGDETITFALTEVTEGGDLAELRAADTTRVSVTIVDDDITRRFYIVAAVDPATVAEGAEITYRVGYDGTVVGATPVTVSWTVAGTEERGADVAADLGAATGEVVFGSGETDDKSVVLRALADTLNEGDERFTISISEDDAFSDVYSSTASVLTTISDDPDDALEISIARSDSGDLTEGAAAMADRQAEFVISVGNATATAALAIPYAVSGAGVSAGDYTLMPTTTVTIAQGVTMATVTLEVVDDNTNEGAETLNVELGTVTGALGEVTLSMPSASAVITTNDAITVSVAREEGDTGGAEGTSAAFVVTLSGGESTAETVVDWSISVSMEAGQASTADFAAIMGELHVPAGETTGRIEVGIADDGDLEADETYTLTLGDLAGGGTGEVTLDVDAASATARIPANDQPALSVAVLPEATVAENAEASVLFRVQYGDIGMMPSEAVSVRYRLSGTATGGDDYQYPEGYDADTTSGTATIGTGASFVDVSVSITNDMRDEDDETVVLELFEIVSGGAVAVLPANTSATLTIEDDDKLSLSVAASATLLDEAAEPSVTFTVSLLDDGMTPVRTRTTEVRVAYVLSGDATGGGTDYTDPSGYDADLGSGVVVLAAGANSTDVTITVVNDNLSESDETITLALTEVTAGGALAELRDAGTTRASVTINDDDQMEAQIAVVGDASTVEQDTTLQFEVSLTPDTLEPAEDVVIAYTIGGDVDSEDYTDAGAGSVTVGMGETTARIMVMLLADDTYESDETLTVTLQSATGANVDVSATARSASVTITNDDPEPVGTIVSAGVYLEGAYGTGREPGLIDALPKRQPYGVSPWNYSEPTMVPHVESEFGLRGVTTTIVDWVLVELRTSAPADGVAAVAPTTGGRTAGLLLSDGRIVGINEAATTVSEALSFGGVSFRTLELPEGEDVYVLIHHRNHLSVLSAQPAATADCGVGVDYCVDFRAQPSYAGCPQSRHADGSYRMVAGDVNRSGSVSWGDDALLLSSFGSVSDYQPIGDNYLVDADLNFDGAVTVSDSLLILTNNLVSSECGARP